jgi:hypothetical protein
MVTTDAAKTSTLNAFRVMAACTPSNDRAAFTQFKLPISRCSPNTSS